MSLRSRLVAVVVVTLALGGVGVLCLQQWVINPQLEALDRREAQADTQRAQNAIALQLKHLRRKVSDWSSWDDLYGYMEHRQASFAQANFSPSYVANLQVSAICVLDAQGRLVWGAAEPKSLHETQSRGGCAAPDEPGQEGEPGRSKADRLSEPDAARRCSPPEDARESFHTGSKGDGPSKGVDDLLPPQALSDLWKYGQLGATGMGRWRDTVVLYAALPILTTEGTGPARGAVVMAKRLDDNFMSELRAQTQVVMTLGANGPQTPSASMGASSLETLVPLSDPAGRVLATLRIETPRKADQMGHTMTRFLVLGMAMVAAVTVLVLVWLLDRSVVGPIRSLAQHTEAISRSKDLSARLGLNRRDEIGQLAQRFDGFCSELQAMRQGLEQRVEERTAELGHANTELRRRLRELEAFNRLAVGRELRMVELKKEVNAMARRAGCKDPYDLEFTSRASEPSG